MEQKETERERGRAKKQRPPFLILKNSNLYSQRQRIIILAYFLFFFSPRSEQRLFEVITDIWHRFPGAVSLSAAIFHPAFRSRIRQINLAFFIGVPRPPGKSCPRARILAEIPNAPLLSSLAPKLFDDPREEWARLLSLFLFSLLSFSRKYRYFR